MLIKEVINKAILKNKKEEVKLLFLEPEDIRIKKAISIIKKKKIATPIILDKGKIEERLEEAKILLLNKKVKGVITGATHSSAKTLYLAFNFIDRVRNIQRVSGSFLILSKDKKKELIFADCAVQPNPDENQLAEIAFLSAETFKFLIKKEPVVAFLSYSTKGSGKGEEAEKIQKAFKIFKKKYPKIKAEGEIQFDAAFDKKIAKSKVAKELEYNVFIFPNLNSGNIGYKIAERLENCEAVGPILQGLSQPINDLSRGCSYEDIINLAAITVLQTK
jgi:phosphate acetyltransferase